MSQNESPEKAHLDAILERREISPSETAVLDVTGNGGTPDGFVDVRDLVVYLNGQPISATFGSAESLVFHSQGTIGLSVYFSKPIDGTVSLDLDAEIPDYEFTVLYDDPAEKTFTVSNSQTLNIAIQLPNEWTGVGGEKVVRFSLTRDPSLIPENGVFSSHLLRIRNYEAGELTGMLSFPGGSALPTLAVRIGLSDNGQATCSFLQAGSLFGEHLELSWTSGFEGFPAFPSLVELSIDGSALGRNTPVDAELRFTRAVEPFSEELSAYLEGFPEDKQPAVYHANFIMKNLVGAASDHSSAFHVTQVGELVLQPVTFADLE